MVGNASDDAEYEASDDELNAPQLAAMDSLWRAQHHDGVANGEANVIESLIRRGQVHGAHKRLTVARRKARSSTE